MTRDNPQENELLKALPEGYFFFIYVLLWYVAALMGRYFYALVGKGGQIVYSKNIYNSIIQIQHHSQSV